jgi:hypothetical protein
MNRMKPSDVNSQQPYVFETFSFQITFATLNITCLRFNDWQNSSTSYRSQQSQNGNDILKARIHDLSLINVTDYHSQVHQSALCYAPPACKFTSQNATNRVKQQNTQFLVDIMLQKMNEYQSQLVVDHQTNAPRDYSSSSTSSSISLSANNNNSHSMPNSSLDENENLISTKNDDLSYYDQKNNPLDYTAYGLDIQSSSLTYSSTSNSPKSTSTPDSHSKSMLSHSIDRILSRSSNSTKKVSQPRKAYSNF